MKAIFLAAGDGNRIKDDIKETSKCLLKIEGKSLLYTSIRKIINSVAISEVLIVVGKNGDNIRSNIGDQIDNVKIKYCEQKKRDGVMGGINTVIDYIDEDAIIQLGDEYYENPDYNKMLEVFREEDCVFGVISADEKVIKNNYSIMFREEKPVKFVEKPETVINEFAGTGLMMVKENLMKSFRELYEVENKQDMVDFLNDCVVSGKRIKPFQNVGYYVNINTIDDYNNLIKYLDDVAKKYFFDEYYDLYTMHRKDINIEKFYQGKFAEVYEAMCGVQNNAEDIVNEYDDSIYFEETDIYKRYLAECRGNTMLELACGSGRITTRLACERINILGVDNSQMMIDILERKMCSEYKKYRKYLKIINDDITTLTKVKNTFDVVILPATTIRLIEMELSDFLNHVYKFVNDNGFFIFDIIEPKGKIEENKISNKFSLTYSKNSVDNIMFFEERHDFNLGKTQVNFYLNSFGEKIEHYLSYTYLNIVDRKRVIDAVKKTNFKNVVFEEYVDDKNKKMIFCVLRK